MMPFLPRTPSLHNTREYYLFWVISNVRAQAIDGSSEMAIWKACNIGCGHEWFHGLENTGKGLLEELPPKISVVSVAAMLL